MTLCDPKTQKNIVWKQREWYITLLHTFTLFYLNSQKSWDINLNTLILQVKKAIFRREIFFKITQFMSLSILDSKPNLHALKQDFLTFTLLMLAAGYPLFCGDILDIIEYLTAYLVLLTRSQRYTVSEMTIKYVSRHYQRSHALWWGDKMAPVGEPGLLIWYAWIPKKAHG